MFRYLKVLYIFYKAALLTNLEYRANFTIGAVLSLINVAWQIGGVWVFFLHTEQIGDWSFYEVLLVIGLFITFLATTEMVLYPNVQELVRHIKLGTMDFILTKPISSQFHATLRKIQIWKGIDLIIGIGITLFALSQQQTSPSYAAVALFGLLCVCALVILYSLTVFIITSAFWFVQLDNVMELLFTFFDAGRYPVTIFPGWLRILLTFVVPIAFVTTVPAAVLLGRIEPQFALFSILLAVGLLTGSILFWQYALRHYSSASS
ncbi:MAG: ABC-2 family transporter protein [Chloroflexota bacterium]